MAWGRPVLRRVRRAFAPAAAGKEERAQPAAPRPGAIRITATGRTSAKAKGDEVVIVEARTASGLTVDLARLGAPGLEIMRDVVVEGIKPVPIGLKILPGAGLDVGLGRGGFVHFLCHPWSGEVRLETAESSTSFDLFSLRHELRRVDLADLLPAIPAPGTEIRSVDIAEVEHVLAEARKRIAAMAPLRARGDLLDDVLAICTPRWRGVTAATRGLFRCILPVPLTPEEHPDEIPASYLEAAAEAVGEAGFSVVVLSGSDPALFSLARRLKDMQPHVSIRQIWHGNYLQMGEAHDWGLFGPWLEAARAGWVDCIGVVRPGMEEFLRTLGVRADFVQNAVPREPVPGLPAAVRNVVGIWLSGSTEYRKMPYASLLALAGRPQLALRASGLGELGARIVDELGIRAEGLFFEPIPHGQVLQEMRRTGLTLYVTLSECMPMVPLESIACGVPCVVGPATRFYDDDYLTERLVVEDPSDPGAIRRHIDLAMEDYGEVRARSLAFLDGVGRRSAESLDRFLA